MAAAKEPKIVLFPKKLLLVSCFFSSVKNDCDDCFSDTGVVVLKPNNAFGAGEISVLFSAAPNVNFVDSVVASVLVTISLAASAKLNGDDIFVPKMLLFDVSVDGLNCVPKIGFDSPNLNPPLFPPNPPNRVFSAFSFSSSETFSFSFKVLSLGGVTNELDPNNDPVVSGEPEITPPLNIFWLVGAVVVPLNILVFPTKIEDAGLSFSMDPRLLRDWDDLSDVTMGDKSRLKINSN